MTYRSRSAARKAHKEAKRAAKFNVAVDEKVRQIPPRIETKLQPIPVATGRGYGPASAFEIGATIERRMEWDRKGEPVYVHKLNEPPSQRSFVVAIQPGPRQLYSSSNPFGYAADRQRYTAQFDVERWRWDADVDGARNVIEWWTYVPRSDRKAYPAVRQCAAYVNLAARALDRFERHPPISTDTVASQWMWSAHQALSELREFLPIIEAAANEWLCEPDKKAA